MSRPPGRRKAKVRKDEEDQAEGVAGRVDEAERKGDKRGEWALFVEGGEGGSRSEWKLRLWCVTTPQLYLLCPFCTTNPNEFPCFGIGLSSILNDGVYSSFEFHRTANMQPQTTAEAGLHRILGQIDNIYPNNPLILS
jgi:hypothetical protein